MVKLLENTFRAVNIGLVNEIALMCHKMDIDVWEVIDAAKTKPFGFMPFYPGPGLGGHCIPIDPFYLSWKARQSGFECRFIELAGQVNGSMPEYVVAAGGRRAELGEEADQWVARSICSASPTSATSTTCANRRRSTSSSCSSRRGAVVTYTDPYVPELHHGGHSYRSIPFDAVVGKLCSCAVVTTDHSAFDYERIAGMPLVVDTRNALKGLSGRGVVLI